MNIVFEKWKDVIGYDNLYKISNFGRVLSCSRYVLCQNGYFRETGGKLVSCQLCHKNSGRLNVTLWKNNHRKVFGVGRLVLEAFVGPCPEGMECCHFPDRDPKNCMLTNVRWDTCKANHEDQKKHGTRPEGEDHWKSKLTEEKVMYIRKRRNQKVTAKKISEEVEVGLSTVWDVIKSRTWDHV